MLIAKLNNLGDVAEIANYTEFGGFSDIPTHEDLKAAGYRKVNLWRSYNKDTEKLVSCDPVLEEPWVYIVKVEPLSKEELETKNLIEKEKIKTERNALLAASDWTQTTDAPLTADQKKAWQNYRKQLRDLPQLFSKFDTVVWPKKP